MTSDVDWDPSLYANIFKNLKDFHDTSIGAHEDANLDQYGEYRHRTIATHTTIPEVEFFDAMEYINYDEFIDDLMDVVNREGFHDVYVVNYTDIKQVKANFELLRPLFGWAHAETIKKTFDVTTQYARGWVSDTRLKQHLRSRLPACNVTRCNEPLATDTIFSDTSAVDSGVTAAQIFVGRDTLVADCYGLKTDKEFVNTLEDNIRELE